MIYIEPSLRSESNKSGIKNMPVFRCAYSSLFYFFSGMRLKTMFLTEGSNGTSIRSIAPFSSEIKKT